MPKEKKKNSKTLNSIPQNKGFVDIQNLKEFIPADRLYTKYLRKSFRQNEDQDVHKGMKNAGNGDCLGELKEPLLLVFKYLYKID